MQGNGAPGFCCKHGTPLVPKVLARVSTLSLKIAIADPGRGGNLHMNTDSLKHGPTVSERESSLLKPW